MQVKLLVNPVLQCSGCDRLPNHWLELCEFRRGRRLRWKRSIIPVVAGERTAVSRCEIPFLPADAIEHHLDRVGSVRTLGQCRQAAGFVAACARLPHRAAGGDANILAS